MDRKRTTSREKTDASPCKWFLISAKRLGKKNKIKCINHFGDALKLNTHSSAINRRGQKDWDAVVQWPILNPGSLGFELGHICAFAPLGKLLQFVSYFRIVAISPKAQKRICDRVRNREILDSRWATELQHPSLFGLCDLLLTNAYSILKHRRNDLYI